uniref:Uncharacterized protein n=1 Tax=Tanacetum cinerariifolium TaxID=118510 RepID=A0A6L2KAW6_TANCI|nr:hypothetical protein [Tanacetum cinerariifolium]
MVNGMLGIRVLEVIISFVTHKVGYAFSVWSALFWHMDLHFQTLSVMFGSAPSGLLVSYASITKHKLSKVLSSLGMDTSWMYMKDRTSSQFTKGVELFLNSIFSDTKCDNEQNEEVITNIERDDIVGMVQDAMGIPNVVESTDVGEGIMDDETSKVFKMLKDGQRPLFKGSKRFTSLFFVTRILHIKVLGGWSNKSCTMVFELFFEALEEIGDVLMPKSYYDANKIVSEFGFSYETWDACPNDEFDDEYASDVNEVPDTVFGANASSNLRSNGSVAVHQSEDPFGLYDLLNKKKAGETGKSSPSLSHPPGFTPEILEDQNDNEAKDTLESLNAKLS